MKQPDSSSPAEGNGAGLLRTFLGRYARPYLPYYLVGLVALLATNGIAVWIPREIENTVNALEAADRAAVAGPVLRIVVLAFVLIIIRTASRVFFFNPGRAIERDLRDDLFAYYLTRPREWFRGRPTADLLTRATHDILSVRLLVGFGFLQVANMALLLVMVASQMIEISPRVTLFAALPLAVGLFVLRGAIWRLMLLYRESQEGVARLEQQVLDGFKGVRVVRDFGASALVTGAFDRRNEELLELRLKLSRIASFELPVVRVVGHLAISILLIWGAVLADEEALGIGEMAAYIAYLSMLVAALFTTGWMLNAIQRGMVSLRRVAEVMPMDSPSARDALDAAPPADPLAGAQEVAVEARDVGVVHGDREVLGGVSFEVKPGEQLGVLGTVGSGKSTLAALLGGLDRASAGEILLGGERLDDLPAGAAQRHVRVVPDVPFLFTRTLAENVALVDPPDEIDRERVRRVLHVSCFEPEEEGLKDGIDTVVGEKGIALSGGQKQRITLARALYAGGSTVVLDDVLSAVDHRTERAILERLAAWRREEGRGVTLVNISNRVSALENAKEILVLDEGRVVERGTPQELAAADGLYARTLALQQAMDEAEEASG